jgi:hypothetical protein
VGGNIVPVGVRPGDTKISQLKITTSQAKAEDPATSRTDIGKDTLTDCAMEAHGTARSVWYLRPADDVLDDRYLREVLPVLDRQLGVAGLRLARLLNAAYASSQCPVR